MNSTSLPSRLADAGVPVVAGNAHSITYRVGGHAVTAELLVADRVSSAAMVLDHLRRRPGHRVLVVCDTITDEARSALLRDGAVDLSISDTGELVLSGAVYRAPTPAHPPRAVNQRRRRRRAAERVCVLTREHMRQSDIAAAVGVSQQAVSLMAEKAPLPDTPMTEAARRERLAALSSVPADDGLVETYWYGMESAVEQVRSAIGLGNELTVPILAGGEVAADALRPWRVPTRGLVYAQELIDLSVVDLVEATADEATLTIRVPADPTVWTTATWWRRVSEGEAVGVPTVDPVVVLEDLTAGADLGDGAPERLADWIAVR
ncbi:hypothetical protein [Mycobacterium avium]